MPEFTIKDSDVIKVRIWVGDVIEYNRKRYKIVKEKQVNWLIQDETGAQFNLRIGSRGAVKSEDQSWAGPKQKTEYEKALERAAAGITLGTAVRLIKATHRSKYGSMLYVVVAVPSNGTLRLAKLGGDGGRYLRNFTANDVEVVDPADVLK